ncbi:MAG: sigma 54-interacting transcriptional regulator [Polyangiaceae bacterium]
MPSKPAGPTHDETLNETPGEAGAPLARPEAYLVVVLEGERPRSGSSRHCLRGVDEVTLGRGDERRAARSGGRLSVTLPSPWMSGAHARIVRDSRAWRLQDAGSRNGTLVNGNPVAHVVLADGDLIEVGRALIVFRDALHAPPATAADFDSRGACFPAPGLGTLLQALAEGVDALVRIAHSVVPVLLRGETGTGKEVVARAVHALSGRHGPFVAVNCGAIPAALLESQLFGHTKGAFSGAVRDEPGFVRAADGGTLFLDEIGDLPAASQAAMLRVLQEGEVVPVGTTRPVTVDLRVVAATNQPLEALVARGAFRTDLLARLDGFTYALSPLRERREDLGLLLGGILGELDTAPDPLTLAPEVARALYLHPWPLNVRELKQCMARAVALAGHARTIERAHLPPAVAAAAGAHGASTAGDAGPPEPGPRLRAQLESLLVEHEGNVAEVARAMGKARMQVHRWMKRFAIDPARFRRP